MTAYQFTPVDAPSRPDVMDAALKLLVALSNPAQAKTNLEKHAANARKEALLDEREEAIGRREAILQAREDTADAAISGRQAEADRRIADGERAADERLAARERDLVNRERAVEQGRAHNVELHADLERRLALVKQASV
jgi:hypothetical protein